MRIRFNCPSCKKLLEYATEEVPPGSVFHCPECNVPVTMPDKQIGPGVTLGGFEIKKVLGRGEMGVVYLATQLSMEREVALKVLPAELSERPDAVERFRQEVRMAARLEHPNIVQAYEAGEDNGVNYLAMAYVDGSTLDDILRQEGPMPETKALEITRDIAEALQEAWDRFHLLHGKSGIWPKICKRQCMRTRA